MPPIYTIEARTPDGKWETRIRTTSYTTAQKKRTELRKQSPDPMGRDIHITTT